MNVVAVYQQTRKEKTVECLIIILWLTRIK